MFAQRSMWASLLALFLVVPTASSTARAAKPQPTPELPPVQYVVWLPGLDSLSRINDDDMVVGIVCEKPEDTQGEVLRWKVDWTGSTSPISTAERLGVLWNEVGHGRLVIKPQRNDCGDGRGQSVL
jgi:hypothetical protein